MDNSKADELMSISSNSLSLDNFEESEVIPNKPVKKTKPGKKPAKATRKRQYAVTIANVPKRDFLMVKRKLRQNRPVIAIKTQTTERENCDGFIRSYANGAATESIGPDSITRLMWEMRNCLQKREYGNLAKLISMFTQMPMGKKRWYTTLIKYCMVGLLHDPLVQGTGLIDLFLEGVVGCHTDMDKRAFLKDISRLPKNIHVTKYDDLWIKYSQPYQFDSANIDKLCEVLNSSALVKPDKPDAADDSSSYDENESSDDDEMAGNETSDAEPLLCLRDELNVLEDTLETIAD